MRISLQPGFILHRRPYRETSLLLDVLTEEHGRISLIAKGVRTNRSTTRAILQPFVPIFVSWQGKTELMTLISTEANGLPMLLKGSSLLAAFYLNELLMYLLHKYDPHPKLYTIYRHTLIELQAQPLEERVLRVFEKRLLEELGYGLHLEDEFNAEAYYQFYPEKGFKQCENFEENPVMVFPGKSLIALAEEKLEEESVLKDVKRLMRLAFKPLLVGKELKSRELFI